VVIDGPEFEESSLNILKSFPNVKKLLLPWNVGKDGWYGHRIYSAISYLFDHEYISYLDQDNSFCLDHIEFLVATLRSNNWDWCHSLRKIYDINGNYACDDNCESLGKYPAFQNYNLVDTSTYLIKRDIITKIGHAWFSGWGGDRVFYQNISNYFPNFGCTGMHTVNYKLDGKLPIEFFLQGNAIMAQKYSEGFPWTN
jgi:hypothetical protein